MLLALASTLLLEEFYFWEVSEKSRDAVSSFYLYWKMLPRSPFFCPPEVSLFTSWAACESELLELLVAL